MRSTRIKGISMADEPKKTESGVKTEGLSTIGKIENTLEKLGVDKLSFNYVSPEEKERARKANPEIEALEEKAKYDAMHGNFWRGEKEHFQAMGKSIMAIPAVIHDAYERISGGHDVKEHGGAPTTPANAISENKGVAKK